eukprot:1518385-Karenia_brevis.AAC.1
MDWQRTWTCWKAWTWQSNQHVRVLDVISFSTATEWQQTWTWALDVISFSAAAEWQQTWTCRVAWTWWSDQHTRGLDVI